MFDPADALGPPADFKGAWFIGNHWVDFMMLEVPSEKNTVLLIQTLNEGKFGVFLFKGRISGRVMEIFQYRGADQAGREWYAKTSPRGNEIIDSGRDTVEGAITLSPDGKHATLRSKWSSQPTLILDRCSPEELIVGPAPKIAPGAVAACRMLRGGTVLRLPVTAGGELMDLTGTTAADLISGVLTGKGPATAGASSRQGVAFQDFIVLRRSENLNPQWMFFTTKAPWRGELRMKNAVDLPLWLE